MPFKRNDESEFKAKIYFQAGLSSYLPVAMLTKTPDDEALIIRLMSAINDPVVWAKALDLFLGPKPS